ncbi:MAG: bifunctional 5,10-methylenetetrahydrofolate dehydrogenase/5,10-methenyltetrahydrofolate cyclohydrolase, partial [Candidatus Nealsonbacteria bacterium]|nr:bifunctional 5,10-methylenetetrahydrofolate dehydrogenase/5,10-methenyltetrahydrofolate cyclohydrolase [Candidatus Nealsonbacteria bacterium]
KILDSLKKEIKNRRLKLRLAVILVGEDPVSRIFIEKKKKACKKIGVAFKLFRFGQEISRSLLKKEISGIIKDPSNSGVVIQLPLSRKFEPEEFLNLIPPKKDVDILSGGSFKKFANGRLPILPPTVGATSALLKRYGIKIKSKNILIVGRGRLVGKPLATWLKLQKAKFSIADKSTKNISAYARKADILISGSGQPNLIRGDMVKEGVVVIDIGSAMKDGKIVGDVDFKSVSKKASYITPVPGGVGPMTVACLLENLVKLN